MKNRAGLVFGGVAVPESFRLVNCQALENPYNRPSFFIQIHFHLPRG